MPSGDAPDGDTPADDGMPEEEVEPTTPTAEVAAPSAPPGLWSVTDHTSGSFEDRDRRRVTDEFNYWVDGRAHAQARAARSRPARTSTATASSAGSTTSSTSSSRRRSGSPTTGTSCGAVGELRRVPARARDHRPVGHGRVGVGPPTGAQVRRMEARGCSGRACTSTRLLQVSPGPVRRAAAPASRRAALPPPPARAAGGAEVPQFVDQRGGGAEVSTAPATRPSSRGTPASPYLTTSRRAGGRSASSTAPSSSRRRRRYGKRSDPTSAPATSSPQ